MIEISTLPFHLILQSAMNEEKLSPAKLAAMSEGNIKERTIRNYRNGSTVPTVQIAREICNLLNIELSDEDLVKSLNLSLERKLEYALREPVDAIRKQLFIKAEDLDFGDLDLDDAQKIELIERRVEELFGLEKTNFSMYIKKLIEDDIKDTIK